MAKFSLAVNFEQARLARLADGLLVAVAVSLPWSTSATGILLTLWLLALIPALDWAEIGSEVATPAGGLPVLLFLLGLAGMAWADVSLAARWGGLTSFFKLLVIPFLLVQFRRSQRGEWVFGGYLVSCVVLLLASTLVQFVPGFSFIPMKVDHVLVKNAATQSGEFVTCIFGLLFLIVECLERRHWWWLLAMLAAVFGMLANMFYVATGRTALAEVPVLLAIFALKKLQPKARLVLLVGAIVVVAAAWFSSPYLRDRSIQVWSDYQKFEKHDARNSSGERIEFYEKSLRFIAEAPIIGHGTGSIPELFSAAAAGKTGAEGSATTNPHNQTFAVAIQLGLIGTVVLWAMWIAHLLLFRGAGLVAWIGLMVVVQNMVGSLFNSHLFDFLQGWTYVVGVGVAGGMMLRDRVTKRGPS